VRRREAKSKINSTRQSYLGKKFDARLSVRALEGRIAALESAVQSLKKAFESVHRFDPMDSELPIAKLRRRGPKPVPDSQLTEMKDTLVLMLESYWPELEPLCSSSFDPAGLKTVLEAIEKKSISPYSSAAAHLLKHFDELLWFLKGDRFLHDPRQIANAFAGVPEIGTWRSLKRCAPLHCMVPFEGRALKDYIRRKHRRLFQTLSERENLVGFAAVWTKYRTKDENLTGLTALTLYESWQNCQPRYESIGLRVRVGFIEELAEGRHIGSAEPKREFSD
jgi:hypothetical protein